MARLGRAQPFPPLIRKFRIVTPAGPPIGKILLLSQARGTAQRMNRQRRMLLVQHQRIVSAAVVSTRRRWATVV
jgi:hypothetical protein